MFNFEEGRSGLKVGPKCLVGRSNRGDQVGWNLGDEDRQHLSLFERFEQHQSRAMGNSSPPGPKSLAYEIYQPEDWQDGHPILPIVEKGHSALSRTANRW